MMYAPLIYKRPLEKTKSFTKLLNFRQVFQAVQNNLLQITPPQYMQPKVFPIDNRFELKHHICNIYGNRFFENIPLLYKEYINNGDL